MQPSKAVFTLKVITPDSTLFNGEILAVSVPGEMGSFGILPGHAPFVSLVKAGSLKITRNDGKLEVLQIESGLFKVENNKALMTAQ